jgi:hypothetical protein
MALFKQSLSRNNDVLLATVCMENKKSRAIPKSKYDVLLGRLNLALSNIDKYDNKLKQMGTRIETLATNVATEVNMVCEGIKLELSLLCTTVDKMNNLKANLSHVTKTLLPDDKRPPSIPALPRWRLCTRHVFCPQMPIQYGPCQCPHRQCACAWCDH